MIRRILCGLLVVIFFGIPAIARTKKNLSPREFALRFYALLYELKIIGLPDAEEFKMIAPFLSPSLRDLILAAKQKQKKYIKENPTHKSPWIEDDLFSISEQTFRYKIGEIFFSSKQISIPIRITDREGKVTLRHTDTILLKRIKTVWRVSNLFYETNEEFNPKNSLRNFLKDEY